MAQILTQSMIDQCLELDPLEDSVSSSNVLKILFRTQFDLNDTKENPSSPAQSYGTEFFVTPQIFTKVLGTITTEDDVIDWLGDNQFTLEIKLCSITSQIYEPTVQVEQGPGSPAQQVIPQTIVCCVQTQETNNQLGITSPVFSGSTNDIPLKVITSQSVWKFYLQCDTIGRIRTTSRCQDLSEQCCFVLNQDNVFVDWKQNKLFCIVALLLPQPSLNDRLSVLDCEVLVRLIRKPL